MRAPYKVNFNELPWEAPSLGIRVKTDENTSVFIMNKIFWLIQDKLAGRPGPDTEPWDLISLREGWHRHDPLWK